MLWLFVFFGGACIASSIAILVTSAAGISPHSTMDAPSIPLAIACVLSGVSLAVGLMLFWVGTTDRRQEFLTLTEETLQYDSGPSPIPAPLMWMVVPSITPSVRFGFQELTTSFRVRTRMQALAAELGPFIVERVGERQRLRVDRGADRVEIGHLLREPEREWLAQFLMDWKEKAIRQSHPKPGNDEPR